MHSVPRKLTLGLILAFGAAACGDDVTVEDAPDPPAPVVRSVLVTPSSATIVQGSTFQFGASVDADAGVSTAVTWSASGGTGISVDQNGLATASSSATGTGSVCATSTVNTNAKSCAQLAITPTPPPATVQIDAVTRDCDPINLAMFGGAAGCGLNTPVIVNNVVGQISVAAVLDRPQTSGTTHVVFQVMNGTTVLRSYTQTVVADQSDESLALQTTLNNRVTQPINTAEYSINGSGAATPFFTNGERTIRVCLSTVVDSCTGAGQTAVALRTFTFANPNGFHVTANITNAGTAIAAGGNNVNGVAARATSTNNFLSWVGGVGMAITATPVNYTGVPLATTAGSYTVNFGQGCDLNFGNRARAITTVANPFTQELVYTNGAAASGTTLNAYELGTGCAAAGTGEVPGANMVDGNGNAFITFVLGGAFGATNTLNNLITPVVPTLPRASAFRVDNRGPGAAAFAGNMNGRQNGWFNDVVALNVRLATNVDGTVTNNPTDIGVQSTAGPTASTSGVTLVARGGVCTSVATCAALAPRTTTAGLAETASGIVAALAHQMIVQSVDLFGNFTNPAATLIFGVDRTLPSVLVAVTAYTGVAPSIAPPAGTEMFFNALNAITPSLPTAWTFTAIDVAPALPAIAAGIRIVNATDARIQGLEMSLTSRTASANVAWCPSTAQLQLTTIACADPGTGVTTTSGWLAGGTTFGWAPGTPIAIDPSGANTQAYYGYVTRSVDQAGNRSADAPSNPAIFDITPPVQTALNNVFAAGNTTTTPGSLTANSGATDNLDFGFAHFLANYVGGLNPGLGGAPLAQPNSVTGSGKATQLFGFNLAGPSILAFQFNRTYTSYNRSLVQVGAAACPGFLVGFVCGTAAATPWATTGLVSSGFRAWDAALNPAAGPLATAVPALTFAGSHPLTTGFGGGNTFSVGTFAANPVAGAPPVGADITINATSGNTASGTLFPSAFVEVVAGAQSPFLGGVEFWYLDTDLGVWARACTAVTPTYSITNTTWAYHCDGSGWVPRSQASANGILIPTTITRAANASFIVAIGRTQLGDAILSNPIAITINP